MGSFAPRTINQSPRHRAWHPNRTAAPRSHTVRWLPHPHAGSTVSHGEAFRGEWSNPAVDRSNPQTVGRRRPRLLGAAGARASLARFGRAPMRAAPPFPIRSTPRSVTSPTASSTGGACWTERWGAGSDGPWFGQSRAGVGLGRGSGRLRAALEALRCGRHAPAAVLGARGCHPSPSRSNASPTRTRTSASPPVAPPRASRPPRRTPGTALAYSAPLRSSTSAAERRYRRAARRWSTAQRRPLPSTSTSGGGTGPGPARAFCRVPTGARLVPAWLRVCVCLVWRH